MKHFIIGGDGLIGLSLRKELRNRDANLNWSTRRSGEKGVFLDLFEPIDELPAADIVYMATNYRGPTGSAFQDCQCDPVGSWRVNVDGPIAIARHYVRHTPGTFIVYLSSSAVEYSGGPEYGRQKAQVEAYMNTIDAAIIRASRVDLVRLPAFAAMVVDIGMARRAGVTRWP
jgi:nucleoside-diphosphate-sugar epimerase